MTVKPPSVPLPSKSSFHWNVVVLTGQLRQRHDLPQVMDQGHQLQPLRRVGAALGRDGWAAGGVPQVFEDLERLEDAQLTWDEVMMSHGARKIKKTIENTCRLNRLNRLELNLILSFMTRFLQMLPFNPFWDCWDATWMDLNISMHPRCLCQTSAISHAAPSQKPLSACSASRTWTASPPNITSDMPVMCRSLAFIGGSIIIVYAFYLSNGLHTTCKYDDLTTMSLHRSPFHHL